MDICNKIEFCIQNKKLYISEHLEEIIVTKMVNVKKYDEKRVFISTRTGTRDKLRQYAPHLRSDHKKLEALLDASQEKKGDSDEL